MTPHPLQLCLPLLGPTALLLVILLAGCAAPTPTPTAVPPTATPAMPTAVPETTCAGQLPAVAEKDQAGYIRLQHILAKARRGEPIVVAGIGGSITEGYNAANTETRYINQVAAWWEAHYPGQVTLVNAGIGATGSGIGAHRAELTLLNANPDFVVVEFAVNDLGLPVHQETMEGLLRKILSRPNQPAVMLLYFMLKDGASTQADFAPLAACYQLPQANYAERIQQLVGAGTITLKDVFSDDVHPNTQGHTYAAAFITEYLDRVLAELPAADAELPAVPPLPAPVYTDTFQYTQCYNNENASPARQGKWSKGFFARGCGDGWVGKAVDSELTFTGLWGTAFGLGVRVQRTDDAAIAAVWVDDNPPLEIDTYLPLSAGSWGGPNPTFFLVADKLSMGPHTLHIKILETKHPEVSANSQHTFEVMNVYAAGARVDDLNDWSYVYTHTAGFEMAVPTDPAALAADASRLKYVGPEAGEVVWAYRHFTQLEAAFFYPVVEKVAPVEFYISAEAVNWTRVTPTVTAAADGSGRYGYTLTGLPQPNYIKLRWTDPAGAPELGQIVLFRAVP